MIYIFNTRKPEKHWMYIYEHFIFLKAFKFNQLSSYMQAYQEFLKVFSHHRL